MKPACSIVIRAYNEERHIGRLLDGITQQSLPGAQIILVDSGSTDATVSIAARYPVEVVHLRPEEFTFGHSLNLGLARAAADVVVIASAHVYPVYPDWLERLLEPFHAPQVALVYGKQRGAERTHFSEHMIFHQWFPDASVARQGHPFCNNANAAIRRTLWEQHPYDESLPALEDLAWARWAFENGGGIAYSAEAEVIHVHNETWKGVHNRYRREGMAFSRIYPQERFGLRDLLRLFSGNAASDLRAAARAGKLGAEWRGILRFRWAQFSGTYQGYRQSGPLTEQLRQAFYYPRGLPHPENGRPGVEPIQYDR